MSTQHRRISSLGAAVVLACAIAQPTASAQGTDLRSPDSRDAHPFAVVAPSSAVDLRSPDTADLASGRGTGGQPVVTIASPQGGFDWGDAGIGAGGALALVLFGLGIVLMTSHRRRGVKPPRAVAH
jgi:hypothetical protein